MRREGKPVKMVRIRTHGVFRKQIILYRTMSLQNPRVRLEVTKPGNEF